jgi:ABC-type antimicrobial peptide transport system permease subunit
MRTAVPPSALASEVREALRPISPDLPTNEFRTLQEMVDRTSSPRRFVVTVLLAFAAFALVLASLGIYAVISYTVNQRRQELGIRMALGASSRELQAGVLLQTLRLAAFGILIGLAGSLALARAISGLLFGVESTDPVTFVGMIAVLVTVAGLAGYLPARRASRVDPLVALRAE